MMYNDSRGLGFIKSESRVTKDFIAAEYKGHSGVRVKQMVYRNSDGMQFAKAKSIMIYGGTRI